jgi:hypothetical protein
MSNDKKTWVETIGKGPRKSPNEDNKLLRERSISSIAPAKNQTDVKSEAAWAAEIAKKKSVRRPSKSRQPPTKGRTK